MSQTDRCPAVQVNRRVPNFECRNLATAHAIHVDPRTGERWGVGSKPAGWNRKWTGKRYGNPKLHRHSQLGVSIARKKALAAPKKGK